ncbi:LAFA_0C08460g1_1 [Lachancea sp. 'fantastica']|nr:LAFA_0C08460g1_1 [Lachancea sp. 'fantastica']
MSLAGEPTKNDSLLTEENLALSAAKENRIDDNESLSELSKIDSNSHIAHADLDLDGFYMSSDAETEKMDDEPTGHVVLSELAQDQEQQEKNDSAGIENTVNEGPIMPQENGPQIAGSSATLEDLDKPDSPQEDSKDVPGSIVKDAESEAIVNQEIEDQPTFSSVPDEMSMGIADAEPQIASGDVQKGESAIADPATAKQPSAPSQQQDNEFEAEELQDVEMTDKTTPPETNDAPISSFDGSAKPESITENHTEVENDEQKGDILHDPVPQTESQSSGIIPQEVSEVSQQKDDSSASTDNRAQDMPEVNASLNLAEKQQGPVQQSGHEPSQPPSQGSPPQPPQESLQQPSEPPSQNPLQKPLQEPSQEPSQQVPIDVAGPTQDHFEKEENEQNDEKSNLKRQLDDVDDNPQFKKPRAPTLDSHREGENDDDNDADEDEDEAEDELPDKADFNDSLANVTSKHMPKKSTSSDAVEAQSLGETESVRLMALKEITEIEHQFAELRQKLYESKLAKLQTETQMCLDGSHPALQSYYQKIDSVRDFKLRRAYQRQRYELECIDKETKATRCCIHQDFMKKVSNVKHEMLFKTTQKWYDINKERREINVVVPDVNYHVPVKIDGKTLSCITGYAAPAQLRREGDPLSEDLQCEGIKVRFKNNPVDKLEVIVDRMRFNNELSDLEGLKRFFNGFPGAPNLSGLKDSEVYEDLQKLQRSI